MTPFSRRYPGKPGIARFFPIGNCADFRAASIGWLDFVEELIVEDGHKDAGNKFFDYFDQYDNAETLEQWYYCFDDFSWVKYNNYTVYVGGEEVNDYYLSKEEAEEVAARWERDGYDDVQVVQIPFEN